MKKTLCAFLALIGLPLIPALFWALLEGITVTTPRDVWSFLIGGGIMTALYLKFRHELYGLYVFAHEMTHAVVGLCCFAKIHSFSVSSHGGSVVLSKSNLAITLSPYCIPFYVLLFALIYWIVNVFNVNILPSPVWHGFFGILTVFHIFYTIDALVSTSQPDTHIYGRFFSYWFILCMNFLFALMALCIMRLLLWRDAVALIVSNTRHFYTFVYDTFVSTISSIL